MRLTWLALGTERRGSRGTSARELGIGTAALFVQAATGLANAREPLTNHADFRVFMMSPLIHEGGMKERRHLCIRRAHARTHKQNTARSGRDFVAAKPCAKRAWLFSILGLMAHGKWTFYIPPAKGKQNWGNV